MYSDKDIRPCTHKRGVADVRYWFSADIDRLAADVSFADETDQNRQGLPPTFTPSSDFPEPIAG